LGVLSAGCPAARLPFKNGIPIIMTARRECALTRIRPWNDAVSGKEDIFMPTQNIYDNPVFFDGYKKLRDNPNNANILEEKPALFSLSPDLCNKNVLDLGCGYGENCAAFKRLGAYKVVGITSPLFYRRIS
jgi:SAM-dependent methyltransferase